MKKIVESIRKRPVNLMLLILVVFAYWINNLFLKEHSGGLLRVFFIGYFNDLICPLFFFSYANMSYYRQQRDNSPMGNLPYQLLYELCLGVRSTTYEAIIYNRPA